MMTINAKGTTPIKMDDKLLNGTFRKDGSLATSNSFVLRDNLKNNTRNAQCTCLGKYYFPRQFLEVEPECYREHVKGLKTTLRVSIFGIAYCTAWQNLLM